MTFNPDWSLRIPRDEAEKIIEQAEVLGDGTRVKDCFWRGYRLGDRYFLGLNDLPDLWETDEENARNYATEP